jgi:two-component system response regulator FlrC
LSARTAPRPHGRSNGLVTPDAMAPLLRHPWPGNVRELENVMHRAVLIETGPSITSVALDIDTVGATTDCGPGTPPPAANSAYLAAFDTGSAAPAGPRAVPSMAALSLAAPSMAPLPTAGRTIEAVEKDMILDTLYRSKGNRSQAASVLGISIRTLRNKLHEYERNGTPIPRPVIIAVS